MRTKNWRLEWLHKGEVMGSIDVFCRGKEAAEREAVEHWGPPCRAVHIEGTDPCEPTDCEEISSVAVVTPNRDKIIRAIKILMEVVNEQK